MKRDGVSPEMRRRLLTNRHGKLTTDQWLDMVTEPLVTLLILLPPALLVLGPRLVVFSWSFWIAMLAVLGALFVPVIFRARRYARAPIYFATLYAGSRAAPFWKFWRPPVLQTASGEVIRFSRRLAPYTFLEKGCAYHVYYLKDGESYTLLSLAPASHPEAGQWQPSEMFLVRFKRRGGQ